MSRPQLDPGNLGAVAGKISVERLPKSVRSFGRYPDISRMQAGDLILVRPVKNAGNAVAIERVQAQTHDAFDAQWIHAATYLGDNSLVEIAGGGVSVGDLHKYVCSHKIMVRRVLRPEDNREVDPLTGYRIAVAALKAFKTKYGFGDLIQIYIQSQQWKSADGRFRLRGAEAICSDYFDAAVAQVLGRGAASAKRNPFSPADLSASANMTDVVVPWAQLPG